jgi:hypothetical protein
MKKLLILTIPVLVIFAFFQNSHAKTYYRTFEVVEIQSAGIVLVDFEGSRYLVEKDPDTIKGGLKVGDSVRYDNVRNVLKKNPWQPATVTSMTDGKVELQLKNGEIKEVAIRSNKQKGIQKGDNVQYKASSGQIKKSNLQKLDEE